MISIIGQCPDCCECPTPSVQWDSRSASLFKYGFREWIGFESSPPKIFHRVDWGGEGRFKRWNSTTFPNVCDNLYADTSYLPSGFGESTLDAYCDLSTTLKVTLTNNLTGISSDTNYNPPAVCPLTYVYGVSAGYARIPDGFNVGFGVSAAVSNIRWEGGSYDSGCVGGTRDETTATHFVEISSEYLTTELISNTLAALPAWDDDWNDTAGTYRDLTDDELSYSIREARYRFRFKIPKVGLGTCYMVSWVERFTPEVGDPVDTPRCAIWDGDIPEDYNPDDPETWPILGDGGTPYFSLAVPEENGTTTVENVVAKCRGCVAGCPE